MGSIKKLTRKLVLVSSYYKAWRDSETARQTNVDSVFSFIAPGISCMHWQPAKVIDRIRSLVYSYSKEYVGFFSKNAHKSADANIFFESKLVEPCPRYCRLERAQPSKMIGGKQVIETLMKRVQDAIRTRGRIMSIIDMLLAQWL